MEDDPMNLKAAIPQPAVISAGHASGSAPGVPYAANYLDECFVLSEGAPGYDHGDVAARLTGETALWGYKLIRQRQFYWSDKHLLMKRIFRSSNIAAWQKRKESGFEKGIAAALTVCMVGPQNIWVGWIGDPYVRHVHGDAAIDCTGSGSVAPTRTKTMGTVRFGVIPSLYSGRFSAGDVAVMGTPRLREAIADETLISMAGVPCRTEAEISIIAQSIIRSVQAAYPDDAHAITIIKRL